MAKQNDEVQPSAVNGAASAVRPHTPWLTALRRVAARKPLGTVSAVVILLLILMAVLADVLAPYPPTKTVPEWRFAPLSMEHPLGGDYIGRDILSNIIHGARLSISVGVISVLLGTVVGATLGILSGYFGGKTDLFIQRFIDTLMAFPTLILAIAIVAFMGSTALNVMIAIGLTLVPTNSRVVRGAVLSVRENQYVEAARAVGAGNIRIMVRHILPNVFAPIIILASIALGFAIIAEASLSFLGLGTPPPSASWGRMLGGLAIQYMDQNPHTLVVPGLAISVVVLAFNLLGDTIRDVLDPRLRGTS